MTDQAIRAALEAADWAMSEWLIDAYGRRRKVTAKEQPKMTAAAIAGFLRALPGVFWEPSGMSYGKSLTWNELAAAVEAAAAREGGG